MAGRSIGDVWVPLKNLPAYYHLCAHKLVLHHPEFQSPLLYISLTNLCIYHVASVIAGFSMGYDDVWIL